MSDETVTSFQEGHAACPFVAFEDDRDHRADHPDYGHRCFAAAEPEPRALPHQERFCLSAAFAQCPIFLDWARQEAAGVAIKGSGTTSAAATQPAAMAASAAAAATPAFLASRGRTTPAEAGPVTPHSSDPGSGLWGFEGAPKRTVASLAVPPATPSGPEPGTTAYTMARRGPTHPDWEKPPRLDNYPRLRSHEDRNNNQPLLLAALGVAIVMIALIFIPLWTGKSGGLGGLNSSTPTPSLLAGGSGASDLPTDTPAPTPEAARTFTVYYVKKTDAGLCAIAASHGITCQQIEAANPQITNFNVIVPGEIIYIPWQTWAPTPAPPTPTPTPVVTPTAKPTPTPKATPTPAVSLGY
jgi:LysM repeat protein